MERNETTNGNGKGKQGGTNGHKNGNGRVLELLPTVDGGLYRENPPGNQNARLRFNAVDADFDFEADFEPPDFFALDFLLELLLAPRLCIRSFSVSICSPRASISVSPSACCAFSKSSFSSSSTWCSTFS